MPEIGFDDEPISPVSRDETVTKRKPKMTIRHGADARIHVQRRARASMIATISADDADQHDLHRHVAIGARASRPRCRGRAAAEVAQPPLQAVPDGRQRAEQADDAARGHRAGADVQDVGVADRRPGSCR